MSAVAAGWDGLDLFADDDWRDATANDGMGGGGSRAARRAPKTSGLSGAFVKDTLRCWLRGWKRFASIAVISLLGVAVLTGIYAGCRDMFLAADRFYDAQGLHDIQVMSTYGLTDDDVEALRGIDGVETVQAERSQSVTTTIGGSEKTVTLSEIGANGLDQPYLVSGRMPSKAGEVAVTQKFLMDSGLSVGDTLSVTPEETESALAGLGDGSDETDADGTNDSGDTNDSGGTSDSDSSDTNDSADATDTESGEASPSFPTKLTITGEVMDPKDLSNPDGIGTAAFRMSLTSDYTFFAPSDGVTGDIYTAISLRVAGTADLDTFSDDYDDAVNAVADRIENQVQNRRQKARRQQIVSTAQQALDDAKKDADNQFADAQQTIDQNRKELESNAATLENSRKQLEDSQQTIADGERQLADGRSQLASARVQIAQGRQRIAEARTQLESGKTQLAAARQQLDAAAAELASNRTQVEQGIAQVDQALGVIRQALAVMDQLDGLQSGGGNNAVSGVVGGAAAGSPANGTVDSHLVDGNPANSNPANSNPTNGATMTADATNNATDDATSALWRQIQQMLAQFGITIDPSNPPTIASIRQQLQTQHDTLQQQRDELQNTLDNTIAPAQTQLDAQDAQLTAKEQETAAGEAELNRQSETLEANAAQLESQAAELESQAAQLTAGKQQVESGLAELENGERQLADGNSQIEQAQQQLDGQRQKADDEFARQQQNIDDVANAQWYVQTRSAVSGFSSLKSDVSSIETIGRAFPVVFLVVAVLMSLTVMTRMVEEERGLIGTYIGLGYGSVAIALRYVLFATLACLIGGGLGLIAGFLGIPAFLMIVLEGLYTIPGIRLEYDWLTGSAGIALFVVGVVAATIIAAIGEMRQTPAELMRPKSPKAGTRVLLERIGPLWRRMSFLNKVTVRNIMRFKSRLIMTVGGVAGCTALIVCGFAINDSVDTIGPKQYEDIIHYDLLVVSGDADADTTRDRIQKDGHAERILDLRVESGELDAGDSGETIQLMVIPDQSTGELNDMVTLRDAAGGHETQTLSDEGILITQSAANALGVKAGDTVTLRDGNMRTGTVKVAGVTRNLIGSEVYVSEGLYKQAFGVSAPLVWNALIATLDGTGDENIAYADELARAPSVTSATSTDDLERSFQFKLMSAVVALIVGLAGGLALAVLFTLANTNVSERVREMATLKVLGFYDREVHTYVNKEMMILTGAGIVVGLPLGRVIGGLLTAVLNMPSIYFEVEVHWWSYLIAAATTLVFALLVQLFTNPVLDRIDPVSSLKSVE